MDAGSSSAPKSSNGAEGADRDCRPDSAARGVTSASGLVTSLSSTMSLTIFSCVLKAGFDPLYSPQLRFEGSNESGSGVGYKRFDDLAPVPVSSPSRVGLDTAIQCSMPAVSYMPHFACWLCLSGRYIGCSFARKQFRIISNQGGCPGPKIPHSAGAKNLNLRNPPLLDHHDQYWACSRQLIQS